MLRKTLSPHFWMHEFAVTGQNLDFLYSELAEGVLGVPAPCDQLALSLIREYQEQENRHIRELMDQGTLYQPRERYTVGQILVFTALDYQTGTVKAIRPGHNPEHGPFDVIAVEMENSGDTVEFAAQLPTNHPLNALELADLDSAELMKAEEIYAQYGEDIEDQIRTAFAHTERAEEFMEWRGGWLLKDMLVTVDEFSRNVAEAKMFEVGGPVSGQEILAELHLDTTDMEQDLVDLSLEAALMQDGRFEPVTAQGESRWYTRSLMPAAVKDIPALLTPVPIHYQFSPLDDTLLALEIELQDEWSEIQPASDDLGFASFHLLYPHFRHGTMPVTPHMAALLDAQPPYKSFLEITDPLHGHRMSCWYIPEGRCICGLEEYYASHKLPIGTRLHLERQADGALTLHYNRRRGRKDWLNILDVVDGELQLAVEKSQDNIACEYRTDLLVMPRDEDTWAAFRETRRETKVFLLVEEIVRELVQKAGAVHAATVYSAINMIQRHPPGPVFHALISNSRVEQLPDQVTFRMAQM